jgi:hypothetical protein
MSILLDDPGVLVASPSLSRARFLSFSPRSLRLVFNIGDADRSGEGARESDSSDCMRMERLPFAPLPFPFPFPLPLPSAPIPTPMPVPGVWIWVWEMADLFDSVAAGV